MKKVLIVSILFLLCGCFEVGEFTPERHAQYELGNPDCKKTPERCIEGVAW